MFVFGLICIPFIALALDYSIWIQECLGVSFLWPEAKNWIAPVPDYFRLGDVGTRIGLCSVSLTFVMVAQFTDGADSAAALTVGLGFMCVYFGFAFWSCHKNLKKFWGR